MGCRRRSVSRAILVQPPSFAATADSSRWELDALPPDVLRGLYQAALDELWDTSAYQRVLAQEEHERQTLR